MFADLVSVAGDLYKHGEAAGLPKLDENTAEAAHLPAPMSSMRLIGDEFIPMISKAGASGFQVTAYADLERRRGACRLLGQGRTGRQQLQHRSCRVWKGSRPADAHRPVAGSRSMP